MYGYPYPHIWYMYMCIGLYLETPMIWKIKEWGGPWNIFWILIAGYMIQRSFQLIWPIKFIPFIGYFLFRNYVRQLNLEKTKKRKYYDMVFYPLDVFYYNFLYWTNCGDKEYMGVLSIDPLCPIVVIASLFCIVFFLL